MRVTVLDGCGAWPAAGQACRGYLVEHGGFRVLVDPGRHPLLRAGRRPARARRRRRPVPRRGQLPAADRVARQVYAGELAVARGNLVVDLG